MPPFLGQAKVQYAPNADVSQNLKIFSDTLGQALTQRRKRRGEQEIGQAAQSGDMNAVQATAFKVGRPDVAMRAADMLQRQSALMQRGDLAREQMGATADYRKEALAMQGRGLDIKERTANRPGGAKGYGMQPIWGKDEQGRNVIMQLGAGGDAVQTQLPEGVTPQPPGVKRIDLGTEWGVIDRSGVLIGRVPKDVAGAASQRVQGKAQGEVKSKLASVKSKLPGLSIVVKKLEVLADEATYTTAGQAVDFLMKETGQSPRASAVARAKYVSMVDNQVLPMLRDTFGAAFTVKEGDTLRATLGDPNKHPEEKKAVLKSFIEQKIRDVEALEAQASSGAQFPKPKNPIVKNRANDIRGNDPLGIR